MAVKFIPIDRNTPYIFPPSVQDYLPDDHLARFVVDIVEQLDLSGLSAAYSGRGSRPYHPVMLVTLLFYGYATGVFSSRKLEQATYDSIPFRYICANTNPDHDTILSFRQRFLKELEALFVEILMVAQAMGLVKLGTVSLDGTKIKANASKHRALSWDYANQLEARLKAEAEELMRLAASGGSASAPGVRWMFPLRRHRSATGFIARAKKEIEARAQERFNREQPAFEAKQAKREAYEKETGKKPGGKARVFEPPQPGPKGKDQVNLLTDAESKDCAALWRRLCSRATMRKRRSISIPTSSLRGMSLSTPMTSRKSNYCAGRPAASRRGRSCWLIRATSVRPT